MPARTDHHLNALLRATSRSFYLTVRVLPRAIRPQIGLAYLLARATDTIADTKLVPAEARLAGLAQLRARILGERVAAVPFGDLARQQGLPAERELLERIEEAIAALAAFSPDDQRHIREVLHVITGGQELDLRRFGHASEREIVALASAAELDDYTFRVAGCVGGFWTKLCRAHLFPRAALDEEQFLTDAIRFGKGLQLVNILRDLPRDLREGRCYLPADELCAVGLTPHDLLRPDTLGNLRPVYDRWIAAAHGHLAAGWRYTNTIPRNERRVRLACAWPILIGARTLALLRAGNPLDPARRLKVTRGEVRGVLFGSLLALGSSRRWERQFAAAVGAGKAVAGPVELP
jgi:farnesyl-diphosphate farnesyltransferase